MEHDQAERLIELQESMVEEATTRRAIEADRRELARRQAEALELLAGIWMMQYSNADDTMSYSTEALAREIQMYVDVARGKR